MKKIYSQGIVHGRFQPFHNDHLRYCLEAKARCAYLWIGLTQYDINSLERSPKDRHRQEPANNPLTYFERVLIIQACLTEAGIPRRSFGFVPFPIENPSNLESFAPKTAPIFTTINDQWNEYKIDILRKAGFNVIVLWKGPKTFEGAIIRRMVVEGDPKWKHCVPKQAALMLDKIGFGERLLRLTSEKAGVDGR